MKKLIEIEKCDDCKNLKGVYESYYGQLTPICSLNEKRLSNISEIPQECPLPDSKNGNYKKYKFCKSINCSNLIYFSLKDESYCNSDSCIHTAKAFHKWLKENNFIIIKKD